MVLDGIISPAFEDFSDFSPFIALSRVRKIQNPFLIQSPLYLLYLGIQMIMPAFAALFPDSSRQVLRDLCPFLRSALLDEVQNEAILLLRPRALNQVRIEHFLPPMQALHIGPPRETL